MKVYLAATYLNRIAFKSGQLQLRITDREREVVHGIENYLESYHYVEKQTFVDKIREDGTKIFLDSGAFSAFTQNVEIDIFGYCEYIHRNKDIIEIASVLDGIGDPLKTWQNQQTMEAQGVPVLPCFHYGEPEEYLIHYIEKYEYITLGGMVPISTPQLKLWLDRLWDKYLTDEDGSPKLKVHGFGLTSIPLMERYPWFSVDSSSWVQIAANGSIYLPSFGVLAVSANNPARKQPNRHINTIAPSARDRVVAEIEKIGFTVENVINNYVSRWVFNIYTFNQMNETYRNKFKKFIAPQPGLF